MKVDDVVQQVLSLGKGSLLAKIDIESAFRNIPVHPQDRHLLGMQWNGQLYVDTVLPFGLRSSPKIFNCIADALQWIARQRGISYLDHYLDDFITAGAPKREECNQNLSILIGTCDILGLPMAIDKQEGPTTCIIFLGVELDTETFELRLPHHKLLRLKSLLQRWIHLRSVKKRDLESLVGQLHDASIVVRSGRTFIRRLIDALKSAHHRPSNSFVRLNVEARSDIFWWASFIEHWNGLSMMHNLRRDNPDIIITSDASGSWGCGAYCLSAWFQYQWPTELKDQHITVKELLPIIIAIAIWGADWANRSILCRCDNEAVVHIVNSGTSKDPLVMGLMRCLHFITAKFNLLLSATHLAGIENSLADALSRDHLSFFFTYHPQANQFPSPIPSALLDLLVHSRPDWMSPSWSSMFNNIFSQHSQKAQCGPIPPATIGTQASAHHQDTSLSPRQNQYYANMSATLLSNSSSIRQSNATYQGSDFIKSSDPSQTPSLRICPSSIMCCEELSLSKRRKIAHNTNAFQ